MKKLLVFLLLFFMQGISADSDHQLVKFSLKRQLGIASLSNIIYYLAYCSKISLSLFLHQNEIDAIPESEHYFLFCLDCNALVSTEEIFGELTAKMFYATSDTDLFKNYCKLMDKVLDAIKNKDYKMFATCSFDGAVLAKRACRLCKETSWKMMQRKEIDFTKITSNRA